MISYKMADRIFGQGLVVGAISSLIFILISFGWVKLTDRIEYKLLKGVTE